MNCGVSKLDFYSVIKRDKLQWTYQHGWILKNIILSKRSQIQKNTYCMIPFIWSPKTSKTNLQGQKTYQWLTGGQVDSTAMRNFPKVMEMFHFLTVMVITAKVYIWLKLIELYTWKCVQFKICKLYAKRLTIKKKSGDVKRSSHCGKQFDGSSKC